MVIEVTETEYRGFRLVHADGKGWKICIGCTEYLFPTFQDAKSAVDAFTLEVIPAHKGKKIHNF